ncbi:MAG: HD domain-containing protein [Deltaproteobacteria bacterium]|nr:HD domain-containing protein [Deltaproteobacteria bacterium]
MTDKPHAPKVTYVSLNLMDLSAEKPFPGPLYLYIGHKLVRYRNKDDALDSDGLDKLLFNHLRYVFIEDGDRAAFEKWVIANDAAAKSETAAGATPEAKEIVESVEAQRRAMLDIFSSARGEPQVKHAIETSKRLVHEFLKKPFAVNNLQALQRYSKGAVDHSVNVSALSVFLGLRLGYSHQLILENLAMGGLFHDIGKMLVERKGDAMMSDDDPAMQEHPHLGKMLLEKLKDKISNEVLMIVAQHHEYLDGSGFPAQIRGLAVYDLARIVTIANVYDNLVSKSTGKTMRERQEGAMAKLESSAYEGKLDPKKLEKSIKILKYSLI